MRVLIVLLIAASVMADPRFENVESYTFEEYKLDFGKTYESEAVEAVHRALFETQLAKIISHNKDSSQTWKMGVNKFTDMTPQQFKSYKGYSLSKSLANRGQMQYAPSNTKVGLQDLPASVDWRQKGVVTPVKNQGGCGSCWAFAATESIESNVAQNTGKLLTLSPQNVVDCTPNPQHCGGSGGCDGATAELAFEYVAGAGIASNQAYPYRAITGKCNEQIAKSAKIKSFVKLIENNYTDLMVAIATVGPIAVSVDASVWGAYSSGVFTGCPKPGQYVDIDHAVQLVGYGTQNGKDYWIVRNSWGSGWGESGYIRIERHSDGASKWCNIDRTPGDGSGCQGGPSQVTVCGSCGIWYDSSYPTGGTTA